jgi:hypothetical protein
MPDTIRFRKGSRCQLRFRKFFTPCPSRQIRTKTVATLPPALFMDEVSSGAYWGPTRRGAAIS